MSHVQDMRIQPRVGVPLHALHQADREGKNAEYERDRPVLRCAALVPVLLVLVEALAVDAPDEEERREGKDKAAKLVADPEVRELSILSIVRGKEGKDGGRTLTGFVPETKIFPSLRTSHHRDLGKMIGTGLSSTTRAKTSQARGQTSEAIRELMGLPTKAKESQKAQISELRRRAGS